MLLKVLTCRVMHRQMLPGFVPLQIPPRHCIIIDIIIVVKIEHCVN